MNLQSIHIIDTPSGCFIMVGRVPGILAYRGPAGEPPTAKQLADCRIGGPRIAGLRTRTWETREAAEAALARYLQDPENFS